MSTIGEHVFISYSRVDVWESRALCLELRIKGFRVWLDYDLRPGTSDWERAIHEALRGAACVLCICSPSAAGSQWVDFEMRTALNLQKSIFPVIVADGSSDAIIPAPIRHIQATDARRDYSTSIERLLTEIATRHRDTQFANLGQILDLGGLAWTHFGSLFWFASEVRKLRLLIAPEPFDLPRVHNSVLQLKHHAVRLRVDKFTMRDIEHVESALHRIHVQPNAKERTAIESKLRMIQDNVAKQAESMDKTFSDGPVPGAPIT